MQGSPTTLLIALLLLYSHDVTADDRRREAECRKIAEKIRQLEARMRRPYSAAQGVRYDERLRALREKRYRQCR